MSEFLSLAMDELKELRKEIKRLNKENSKLWEIIAELKKEKEAACTTESANN